MDGLVRYHDQFPISPQFYIRDDELEAVMREIFKTANRGLTKYT